MAELKECPFCGGKAAIHSHFNGGTGNSWDVVTCTKCGVSQPVTKYYSREEAKSAWNRRPSPSTAPLTLDELRKMDGEPVWTVPLDGSGIGEWTIITIGAQTEMLKALSPDTAYNECNYAKAWLAYRRKLKEN